MLLACHRHTYQCAVRHGWPSFDMQGPPFTLHRAADPGTRRTSERQGLCLAPCTQGQALLPQEGTETHAAKLCSWPSRQEDARPCIPLLLCRVVRGRIACPVVAHRNALTGDRQGAARVQAALLRDLRQRAPHSAHLVPLPHRILEPLQHRQGITPPVVYQKLSHLFCGGHDTVLVATWGSPIHGACTGPASCTKWVRGTKLSLGQVPGCQSQGVYRAVRTPVGHSCCARWAGQ